VAIRAAGEEPPLRSELREEVLAQRVLVPFRLWDSWKRRYVTDPELVRPEAFALRESLPPTEGERGGKERWAEQKVLAVDLEERPLSLVLAVDTSASMQAALPSVQEAAGLLVEGLEASDRAALVAFNDLVTLEANLTTDRDEVGWALEDLAARGNTAVHDALHQSLQKLAREPDPRAIIVLTDGVDNKSRRSLESVVAEAYEAGIPLFCIFHRVTEKRFRTLSEAARRTGGQVFESDDDAELARVFARIAEGLRFSFLLSYASTNRVFDGGWREIRIEAEREGWEVQAARRGYRVLTPEEAEARRRAFLEEEPGTEGPLPLPEAPREEGLRAPLPALLCREAAHPPPGDWCQGEMRARLDPEDLSALEIRGWVDLAHEREVLVDPGYGPAGALPEDPRQVRLVNWGEEPGHGRFEPLLLPLEEPDRLPSHLSDLLEEIFRLGGDFRVLGLGPEEAGEGEGGDELFSEAAALRREVPPVPGAGEAATRDEPAPASWWVDGEVGLSARETLARWIFLARRPYQEWVRDRFEEDTERLVEQQLALLGRHAPLPIGEEDWDRLSRALERELRRQRRAEWRPIAEGEVGATGHLLPWYRDVEAGELMALAEAVLISELLERPLPDFAGLQRDWLFPARESWDRLRLFLAPTAHRSLLLLRPVYDRRREEIYLPRVLLSRIEASFGSPLSVELPAPRPEAFETVVKLLLDPEVGERLAGGRYWCPDDGAAVWVSKHRNWIAHGEAWWEEMDLLLRAAEERRLLRREMKKLIREAVRGPKGSPETRVFLVLVDTDSPAVGLTLYRRGESPVLASPLRNPGYRVELRRGEAARGLPELLAGAGVGPSDERANTLLVAAINGWSEAALRGLIGGEEVTGFLAGAPGRSLRLVFDPEAPLLTDRLPHLLRTETETVLELNLATARAEEASAELRRLLARLRTP
jgi:Ca-activated chloride channel family protein